MHQMKKRRRNYLRVQSVQRTPAQKEMYEQMTPLSFEDVRKMKEQDMNVKLCDMGNACYIDNHYSDII